MNRKRINIVSCLAKMPLLLLYVCFFVVQLFFNFDFVNHTDSSASLLSDKHAAVFNQVSHIAKTNKAKDQTQTIRLNKRFEPQQIPASIASVITPVAHFVEVKVSISTHDIYIPSPILLSPSFRGPPVVVV